MQVLLEPIKGGIRASSGSPLSIAVEAVNEAEAISKLQAAVTERLEQGSRLVDVPLPVEGNPWLRYAGTLPNDELTAQWIEAMAEYRRERDADDADLLP